MQWWRKRKRAKWMEQGLPDASWSLIEQRVPMVGRYNSEERLRLGGITRTLLEEKRFEGCAGFVITDEVRLTIGVQAAMLILNRPDDFYSSLRSVLVYPAGYIARFEEPEDGGIITEVEEERLGEAWPEGSVVLSWADVLLGAADEDDGRNVVFHEFAHLLDGRTGEMDGLPDLAGSVDPREWARVMNREYRRLSRAVRRGQAAALDEYGASHPAEFFAVATELFFERPCLARGTYPEMYRLLVQFYRQDPAKQVDPTPPLD